MKKKTVIAGELDYVLRSFALLFTFGLLGGLFYALFNQNRENPYGIYLIDILPNITAVVFGAICAVFVIKMLCDLQFATFGKEGISFRSVLFPLGKIKWEELVAVRYESIEIKSLYQNGKHYTTLYEPRIYIVLQTKEYRRLPKGRLNKKYGEHLRVLPEGATLTVADFLAVYRPDLEFEGQS